MAISIVSALEFREGGKKGRHDRGTISSAIFAVKVARKNYRYSSSLSLGTRWR